MQNIKAKKESLIRVLGTVLILFGLLISVVLDFFILDFILYIYILSIFIPWFFLIILLKLEIDILVEYMLIFMIVLTVYSIILIIIGGLVISTNELNTLIFVVTAISNILIILCWQFALSIYKKKKLVFLIGGIGYCLLTAIFRLGILMAKLIWFISLVPLTLIILGMCLTIFAELWMKKKGLLNWV
ncbi:MAG: hypothetical protein ACFFAN_10085 [Promethearchaeota archaeon]